MSTKNRHTKFIFITGGVVSSLGKGIVSACTGALLETRGLKVVLSKADPYINIDPGTMSPVQHGEVFVTRDGAETDLDIGHYERFTRASLNRFNSFSAGKVYDEVLSRERKGDYLGTTVQVVPHITDQIKANIFKASEGADISIVEIGGTVGDIESLPFLETIRQIRYELGSQSVLCIHLTLVPYIAAAQELKTKPTQHSVKELRSIGIQPDILLCRADREVPEELRNKIAVFCNVKRTHVFEARDVDSIYNLPLVLHEQGLDQIIVDSLNIWTRKPDLREWMLIRERLKNPKKVCSIGVVGKYTNVVDAYKSISEALIHAGIANEAQVNVEFIDAVGINEENVESQLSKFDGIIIPGGFGERGIEGKILSITYARKKSVPFLGICLGMQLALIEFARNVLGLKEANSVEFQENTKHPIIHLMDDQARVTQKGATMRLGEYPCALKADTKVQKAYAKKSIQERHRHRYEFNNVYKEQCEQNGVVFSGIYQEGNLVEIIELKDHLWFVGCQFHPELKSRPMEAHPLFNHLVKATLERKSQK